VAYNILATIKAALAAEFGWGKIEAGLSDFYLVDEIQGTYRGMTIAVPDDDWQQITDYSPPELVAFLRYLATKVNLKRFRKSVRGPKKKRPPLIIDPRHRHLSTARKLQEYASQK
ncbi:MAG: IS4/IS5 family transposase, partial [Chloroflexota bacterium]